MAPSLDVVVPCYNYGRYLEDCIASILSQTANVRVLIIDDASTDDSVEIATEIERLHPEVTVSRHPSNRGHIATYNEGIDWADATYFTVVSADDLMMPSAFASAVDIMRDAPDVLMVHGRALHFVDGIEAAELFAGRVTANPFIETDAFADGTSAGIPALTLESRLPGSREILSTEQFYRRNRSRNAVAASGVIVRTDCQKEVGGYLESLPHAADYEMWLRIASNGPVGYLPRFQVAVRHHRKNMSSTYNNESDVMQRYMTFKTLERTCAARLGDRVLRDMYLALAGDAVVAARINFANGDPAASDRLFQLARELDPTIVHGVQWKLHSVKKVLGPTVWNAARRLKPGLRTRPEFSVASAVAAATVSVEAPAGSAAPVAEQGGAAKDKRLRVVFCASPDYYQHLAVAATSLVESNRGRVIDIAVVTCEHDIDAERMLEQSLSAYSNVRLSIHLASESAVGRLFVNRHITKESYLRIIAPTILKDVESFIYLDSDLVVLGDLSELADLDLGEKLVAGVPDLIEPRGEGEPARLAALGFPAGAIYINAGVLVINARRWREESISESILGYVEREGSKLKFHDQDAINICLWNRTLLLGLRWNVHAQAYRWWRKSFLQQGVEARDALHAPAVIHYSGSDKPWQFRSPVSHKGAYFRHLRKTAWWSRRVHPASRAEQLEHSANVRLSTVGIDAPHLLGLSTRASRKLGSGAAKIGRRIRRIWPDASGRMAGQ